MGVLYCIVELESVVYGCTVLYSVVGECGVWVYCTV